MAAAYGPAAATEHLRPLNPGDPVVVGDFRLLGRLGAGGFGTVYLGRSASGRLVAVKVVHADIARDPGFRARFGREVAAVQQVGGFFTAPLVAADAGGDPPWLATAYVPGPSLAEIVATAGPFPEPALWWLAAGIAEALVGIHAAGVTHRDLKPGNVIVAADGPRVIDFGIARTLDPLGITTSRLVIGTPAFMPPEQARDLQAAGPPADVYALGATLAYAGTGRPPYAGDDFVSVLARLVSGDPPDLTGLPPALEGLVRACLAQEPGQRPTPTAVLDTVRTHVDPSDLDPPNEVLPRTALDLIDAHTVALAALLETRPGSGRRRGRLAIAGAGVTLVAAILVLGLPQLQEHPASPSPTGSPSATPRAAALRPITGLKVIAGGTASTTAAINTGAPVAYAPDGRSLATGEISGTVLLRNTRSGAAVGALPGHSGRVTALAYGPVGHFLATLDEAGTLRLWDVTRSDHPARLWEQPAHEGTRMAFGPGGDLLAIAGKDGFTRLYTVTASAARPYSVLPILPAAETYSPAPVVFSSDSQLTAMGANGELHLWDTRSGREIPGWPGRVKRLLYDATFTPDGRRLITLEGTGPDKMVVRLWHLASGRLERTLPMPVGAHGAQVAVSPDGRFIATTAGPASVTGWLWSLADGKNLGTFRGPRGLIWGLAFHPDGRALATVHGDGALRLWDLSARE